MVVSVITMQVIYVSMVIMQVTMAVALRQILRCYFLLLVCWWIFSVTIMQVTVSVAVMQLEVSAAHMQVTVSVANMWVTIFIEVCCNYAGGIFCSALCT